MIKGKCLRIYYCHRQGFFLLSAHVCSAGGYTLPTFLTTYYPGSSQRLLFEMDSLVIDALCFREKLMLFVLKKKVSGERPK
jgi:hypothetical protein